MEIKYIMAKKKFDKTKFTREEIKAIIIDIGTDEVKEITKAIEVERRKSKDLYVNFACRIQRKHLDWLKHYADQFGSASVMRLMGDTVSEFVERNMKTYPMLDHFGKLLVTTSKRGRRPNKPSDDAPVGIDA